MAAIGNLDAYSDALVVLGTAGIVVPLVRRFGLSPVLGYLGAGAILGPLGLGCFIDQFPFLYWVTVVDATHVSAFAELGVVFLLFLIGLELSYERLLTMRRLVFGLGFLQVALCTAVIAGVVAWAGSTGASAVVIGSCLALSSTAIVIEVLSNQRRLSTTTGRTSFSILLAQDMAVVPILLLVSILGNGANGSLVGGIAPGACPSRVRLRRHRAGRPSDAAAAVPPGRLRRAPASCSWPRRCSSSSAPPSWRACPVCRWRSGAFVAGLLLAETEFRKAIETTIEPFKGLLLGLFFFTVGMNIDFRELAREPLWLFAGVVGLIASRRC